MYFFIDGIRLAYGEITKHGARAVDQNEINQRMKPFQLTANRKNAKRDEKASPGDDASVEMQKNKENKYRLLEIIMFSFGVLFIFCGLGLLLAYLLFI
jgi:hypothetical protein